MARYKTKSVEIEAVYYSGKDFIMPEWLVEAMYDGIVNFVEVDGRKQIHIYPQKTLPNCEGIMTANVGDYILRGKSGSIIVCKADVFKETYEAI